jgi:hypothetical protein
MSLAYRLRLRESETRVLEVTDGISTRLELLDVLPAVEMARLLRRALQQRGFVEQRDGTMRRRQGQGLITVDPSDGTVTVTVQEEQEVTHTAEKDVPVYAGASPEKVRKVEGGLLREQLAKQFAETQVDLQRSVADECERILQRIESELDAVVNQVMREAIKIKARQMGEIREIHEDATTGELTIKLEV